MDKKLIKSEDALIYITISMLSKTRPYKGFLPEILTVFKDLDSLKNFIRIFGGETIKVPTSEKFAEDLNIAIMAYHIKIEGKTRAWVGKKFGVNGNKLRQLDSRINAWMASLSEAEEKTFLNLK